MGGFFLSWHYNRADPYTRSHVTTDRNVYDGASTWTDEPTLFRVQSLTKPRNFSETASLNKRKYHTTSDLR